MSGFQASKIKNIIFDLGGVLLNINPLLSLLEFSKISGLDQDKLKNRLARERVFEKFDTGSLSPAQFRSELCRIMDKNVTDEVVDRAWNILLLDFPLPRVQLLEQLRKNYRIFLLSNTNSIHFEYYAHDFFKLYGFQMSDLFEELYLSYEIGMHKPDAGIYTFVLQKADLNPDETVFIDDSSANIEAAELQGIAGIHINNGKDVTEYFNNGILL